MSLIGYGVFMFFNIIHNHIYAFQWNSFIEFLCLRPSLCSIAKGSFELIFYSISDYVLSAKHQMYQTEPMLYIFAVQKGKFSHHTRKVLQIPDIKLKGPKIQTHSIVIIRYMYVAQSDNLLPQSVAINS